MIILSNDLSVYPLVKAREKKAHKALDENHIRTMGDPVYIPHFAMWRLITQK